MLCDRKTTSVVGCQPGFLNFIVIPLFGSIVKVMPEMMELLESGKANVANWQKHMESEEERAVYKEKKQTSVLLDIDAMKVKDLEAVEEIDPTTSNSDSERSSQ